MAPYQNARKGRRAPTTQSDINDLVGRLLPWGNSLWMVEIGSLVDRVQLNFFWMFLGCLGIVIGKVGRCGVFEKENKALGFLNSKVTIVFFAF